MPQAAHPRQPTRPGTPSIPKLTDMKHCHAWQAASGSGAAAAGRPRRALASSDGLTVLVSTKNTLDTAAYLQLTYAGGHKEVIVLAPHSTTVVRHPQPQPPMSHAALAPSSLPSIRLVVDVLEGRLKLAGLGASATAELYCCVEVAGQLAALMPAGTAFGMATRALAAGGAQASGGDGAGQVGWAVCVVGMGGVAAPAVLRAVSTC